VPESVGRQLEEPRAGQECIEEHRQQHGENRDHSGRVAVDPQGGDKDGRHRPEQECETHVDKRSGEAFRGPVREADDEPERQQRWPDSERQKEVVEVHRGSSS